MGRGSGIALYKVQGEMRIKDVELGEKLGFADFRMVRKLIKSNRKSLSELGKVCEVQQPLDGVAGRPATVYYLNKAQAVFISLASGLSSENTRLQVVKMLNDMDAVLDALNDFEVPEDLPDMYVYAIREKDTGNIKLGISRDPQKRLRQLQTGNSSALELVAYHKAENRFTDERELHADAALHKIRGEWFSASALEVM